MNPYALSKAMAAGRTPVEEPPEYPQIPPVEEPGQTPEEPPAPHIPPAGDPDRLPRRPPVEEPPPGEPDHKVNPNGLRRRLTAASERSHP